jgi:hypothetical protein
VDRKLDGMVMEKHQPVDGRNASWTPRHFSSVSSSDLVCRLESSLPFDGSSRLQDIDPFIYLRQHLAEADLLTVRIYRLLPYPLFLKKLLMAEQ